MRMRCRFPFPHVCLTFAFLGAIIWLLIKDHPAYTAIPFGVLYAVTFGPERYRAYRTRRELKKRPAKPVQEQVDDEDIIRLWNLAARFYKVPPERIRAEDLLRGDIAGVVVNPDNDAIFLFPTVGSISQAWPDVSEDATWLDLLQALRRAELQTGKAVRV